jgi:hypothetical protein
MPKYPTSNGAAAFGRLQQQAKSQSESLPAASQVDRIVEEVVGNDVTEPLTGRRTPYATCTRPYYADAVVVMQLLNSDMWAGILKPFGGLRSRCPSLQALGVDSDTSLLAALQQRFNPNLVESRDDQSAWTSALNQCARIAFEKLLAAAREGWLTPVMFDRDGNTVMHLASRSWNSSALSFLESQVCCVCRMNETQYDDVMFTDQHHAQQRDGHDERLWLHAPALRRRQRQAARCIRVRGQQIVCRGSARLVWANKCVYQLLFFCGEDV